MKTKCKWCNGKGYDQEHYYSCLDCNIDKVKKLKLKRITDDIRIRYGESVKAFSYYKTYRDGTEMLYSAGYIFATSIDELIQADKENKKKFKKDSFVQRMINKLFFMRMKLFK